MQYEAGTEQHPDATDLSRYLVHLTRSEDDLAEILDSKTIEARSCHGIAAYRGFDGQRSVCLTEIPIPELRRMADRGRTYGLVFHKDRLRTYTSPAQPVWYISDSSPQHAAMNALMASSSDSSDPVWALTPFVDVARGGGHPHDWRWEREWRVVGDLTFDLADVVAVIVPRPDGSLDTLDGVGVVGRPFITPDGDFFWSGLYSNAVESSIGELLSEFRTVYLTVEDASLPLDREAEYGYAEIIPILEAEDAVAEFFHQRLPAWLDEAVIAAVNVLSPLWCRVLDTRP